MFHQLCTTSSATRLCEKVCTSLCISLVDSMYHHHHMIAIPIARSVPVPQVCGQWQSSPHHQLVPGRSGHLRHGHQAALQQGSLICGQVSGQVIAFPSSLRLFDTLVMVIKNLLQSAWFKSDFYLVVN